MRAPSGAPAQLNRRARGRLRAGLRARLAQGAGDDLSLDLRQGADKIGARPVQLGRADLERG